MEVPLLCQFDKNPTRTIGFLTRNYKYLGDTVLHFNICMQCVISISNTSNSYPLFVLETSLLKYLFISQPYLQLFMIIIEVSEW